MSESPRQIDDDVKVESKDRPRYDSPSDDRRGRSRSPRHQRRSSPDRRERAEAPPGTVIYIARLSRNTRESELREAFSRYGNIKQLVLKSTFAFLTYDTTEAATEAINRMNGAKFVNGEEIVVEPSGTEFI
jgi:RNA recognition motif-containing protein